MAIQTVEVDVTDPKTGEPISPEYMPVSKFVAGKPVGLNRGVIGVATRTLRAGEDIIVINVGTGEVVSSAIKFRPWGKIKLLAKMFGVTPQHVRNMWRNSGIGEVPDA